MDDSKQEVNEKLKLLSYSYLNKLHECARKFELYMLNKEEVVTEDKQDKSLTFAFGHAVGTAIQSTLLGLTEDQILWSMFISWPVDLAAINEKQHKSFYCAVLAAQNFRAIYKAGFLAEYQLLYLPKGHAIELSFLIEFPDGFGYRGSMDAVLQHKETGAVTVLEIKTSSISWDIQQYRNSAQALGYSTILAAILPDVATYDVLYLEYNTKKKEYEVASFMKNAKQRKYWMQQVLLDIEMIKMYSANIFPMRGESCYKWNKPCSYLGVCTLDTDRLVQAKEKLNTNLSYEEDEEGKVQYSIKLKFEDIINSIE